MSEGLKRSFCPPRVTGITLPGLRRMFELSLSVKNPLHFEFGEPNWAFKPPAHILEAAAKAVHEDYNSPHMGLIEFREAVAEKLERENGMEVDPKSEVLITVGSEASIYCTFEAVLDEGDEVLIPEPSYYPVYEAMVKLMGGVAKPVPLDKENGFKLDVEAIERSITPRTKAIAINTPVNPVGAVFSRRDLEHLAEVAKSHHLLVVSDEAYEKLVFDDAKHYSIGSFPGMRDYSVTVQSFSKSYSMTGFRIGYMATNKALADAVGKIHYYANLYASTISQRAALAALTGPQDYVREIVQGYDERRRLLVNGLNSINGIKCPTPKGAFYTFPDVSGFGPSEDFAVYLLNKTGVVTAPGSSFGTHGEGNLRITFANPLEKISECVRRIRIGVDEFKASGRKLASHA